MSIVFAFNSTPFSTMNFIDPTRPECTRTRCYIQTRNLNGLQNSVAVPSSLALACELLGYEGSLDIPHSLWRREAPSAPDSRS